jgi:quercetin dioxygenase-like cupin family protein
LKRECCDGKLSHRVLRASRPAAEPGYPIHKRRNTMNYDHNPHSLVDMIEYQKDAVVSKIIIRKMTGEVSLFAFDMGQGLHEHTAPFDALIQILDGEAEISISGESFHAKRGEIMIMPAHKPHALQAVGRFKMLLIMIKS